MTIIETENGITRVYGVILNDDLGVMSGSGDDTQEKGLEWVTKEQSAKKGVKMSKKFKFELGENVVITCSGEFGEIRGRAEYKTSSDQYFIRYKNSTGRATEEWWNEDALVLSKYDSRKRKANMKEGDPCDHPGCLLHVLHPCEGCGRVDGNPWPKQEDLELQAIDICEKVFRGFPRRGAIRSDFVKAVYEIGNKIMNDKKWCVKNKRALQG